MKHIALVLVAVAAFALFGCVAQNASTNSTATPSATAIITATPTLSGGISVKAAKGDTVAVDYVGTLDNGTVFDTSLKDEAVKAGLELRPSYEPLEFTVGAGQMIKGFDAAVVGMQEGEEKKIHLQPSEAYGEWSAEQVVEVPLTNVPNGTKVGAVLSTQSGARGKVIEVTTNGTVKIDFNSDMAGKALNFRIVMRKITKG